MMNRLIAIISAATKRGARVEFYRPHGNLEVTIEYDDLSRSKCLVLYPPLTEDAVAVELELAMIRCGLLTTEDVNEEISGTQGR